MNLLIDAHCFDHPSTEGINTYIKGIYTLLPNLAPDISFYFAANDIDKISSIFGCAHNINYIPLKSDNRVSRVLSEFPSIINKYNIDIAHFQYFTPPTIHNCRTVVTLHDILFRDFPSYFPLGYRLSRDIIFRYSAHHADILVTVSEYSRERIALHYNISPADITVTPNAVSSDFFDIDREKALSFVRSRGIRPYILNVSRIEPRKNQLSLLRAYVGLGLAARGYDLVLINQPTLPVAEFNRYLISLPDDTRRHIHQLGTVEHEELKMWYAAAELFVYPSLAEGFGIPPIEAGAAGVPVICHDSTAMTDFSFFGDNLADISDSAALGRLIERNLSAPPSGSELKKISDSIRQSYNWRHSADTLLARLKNF